MSITPIKYCKLDLGFCATMQLVGHNHVTNVTREKHTRGAEKLWVGILASHSVCFFPPTDPCMDHANGFFVEDSHVYDGKCGRCVRRAHCTSLEVKTRKFVFHAGVSLLERNGGGMGIQKILCPLYHMLFLL